jgi:hypothetical protein
MTAFAIPNGGYRRKTEAAIFKGQGVRAGVPDIFLLHEGRAYFLELKRDDGRLSANQVECLEELEGAGAICHVAHGLDAAIKWLEERRLLVGEAA